MCKKWQIIQLITWDRLYSLYPRVVENRCVLNKLWVCVAERGNGNGKTREEGDAAPEAHIQHAAVGSSSSSGNSSSKTRRRRTAFTSEQLLELEREFHAKKYLSLTERSQIAAALKLSEVQVSSFYTVPGPYDNANNIHHCQFGFVSTAQWILWIRNWMATLPSIVSESSC